jgi:hypothetical protein
MARAFVLSVLASALAVMAAMPTARAGDEGPVIVIPSRPGIPIVINGRDASYAVVEGDWGLARPGHTAVTVIGGAPLTPSFVYTERNPYHPRYGMPPPRGRNEIEPPPDRALPDPAEPFSRVWSTVPDAQPVRVAPPRQRPQPADTPDPEALDMDMGPPTINDPQPYDRPGSRPQRKRRQ